MAPMALKPYALAAAALAKPAVIALPAKAAKPIVAPVAAANIPGPDTNK